MEVFTIGFTQSSAAHFFRRLRAARIRCLLDVRLNTRSQLAGFAKRDDLAFFLRELCDAEYVHEPLLAPTPELLDAYKKRCGEWAVYKAQFLKLMAQRQIETRLARAQFEIPTALLCSEATAEHCHRRLVFDYLQTHWNDLKITHL